MGRRRKTRMVGWTTAVLLGVLVLASVLAMSSVQRVTSGFDRLETTRTTLTVYLNAQDAITEQAVAEAAYRRAPSEAAKARLLEALAAVPPVLDALRVDAAPRDLAVADQLLILSRRYATEVRTSLDATGDRADRDDRVAGPALDAMDTLVRSAIAGHREQSRQARESQRRTLDNVTITTPLVLGIALLGAGIAWWNLVGEHRRLGRHAREQEHLAGHDGLTDLPNRTRLWREIDLALASARPDCALLMLDLNGFKTINDTYGHAAGDIVLVTVADRLRELADEDTFVGRLGGDEFAVLVRPAGAAAPMRAALVEAITQPVDVGLTQVRVGTSIGIAVAEPEDDRSTLARRADGEMYADKLGRAEPARPDDRREHARGGPKVDQAVFPHQR